MVDKDMEEICKKFVIQEKDPDVWIKPLTKALDEAFVEALMAYEEATGLALNADDLTTTTSKTTTAATTTAASMEDTTAASEEESTTAASEEESTTAAS